MSERSQAGSPGWLLDTVKRNPEGLLLLAAGAVLMMRKTGAPRAVQAATQAASQYAGDAYTNLQHTAAKTAEQTKDTMSSYASAAASSAADYAATAGRTIGEQSTRLAGQAQSVLQTTINRVVQDQPLAIVLAGLAAGAAVAAAFPATELEKQALGPVAERVSDTAQKLGDQLKQAAANASEKIMSAADERGLNVEGLKEIAGEAASAFTGTMTGKTDNQRPGSGQPTQERADKKH